MNSIGISMINSCIPQKWIDVEDILKCWSNSNLSFLHNAIGIENRRVIGADEDVVTLSVSAINKIQADLKNLFDSFDGLFVGSNTMPELFRANAIQIKEMLTNRENVMSEDIQASENSSILGLINAYTAISSNMMSAAIVVGSDVLGRHIAPGSLREYYAGSAASAALISRHNVVAAIKGVSTISSDFPEIGRPEDERFFRNFTSLNSGIVRQGMIKHCVAAVKEQLKKSGHQIENYKHVILPEFTMNSTKALANVLKVTPTQLKSSLYFKNLGDIGNAGPLLGLQMALENSDPDDDILLVSYGHSAQAVCMELKVTSKVKEFKHNHTEIETDIKELTEDSKVDYATMLKLEDKLIQTNQNFGSFL